MLQVLVIYIHIFLIFVCFLCKVVNLSEIVFLVLTYIMIVIVHISYDKFILAEQVRSEQQTCAVHEQDMEFHTYALLASNGVIIRVVKALN